MDDIEKRLREAADNCIKCYEAWKTDKKTGQERDALMESIHELRKVAARLEIDIAVSERSEIGSRPLPIPPHRSARRRGQNNDDHGDDDNFGNTDQNNQQPQGGSGSGGGRGRGGPRGPRKRAQQQD